MIMGSVSRSEDEVDFGPVASTMMACPDPLQALEADLAAALEDTQRIDLQGSTLRLLNGDRVERARLTARYIRH